MSKIVTASADSSNGMVANIQMGEEHFVIDETGLAEGMNRKPDPYDYIMSALGACTVITLHMYAQRKKWPLERAEVTLKHERIHKKDCEDCDIKDAKLNQVTKTLRLVGNLTQEQRTRLEQISSRCPVQKTLEAGISVITNLAEPPL